LIVPRCGHATMLCGINLRGTSGEIPMHMLCNSWGPVGPMKGIMAISMKHSIDTMLGGPIIIRPGKGFFDWPHWSKYVIKNPDL
jgi:hypothetical protein